MQKTISLRKFIFLTTGIAIFIGLTLPVVKQWIRNRDAKYIECMDIEIVQNLSDADLESLVGCKIHTTRPELLNIALKKIQKRSPDIEELGIVGSISDLTQVKCQFHRVVRLQICSQELSVQNADDICRVFPSVAVLSIQVCALSAEAVIQFAELDLNRIELIGPIDPANFDTDAIAVAFAAHCLAPNLTVDLGRSVNIEKFACDDLITIDLWNMACSFQSVCDLADNAKHLREIRFAFSEEEECLFRKRFPSVKIQ